MGWRIDINCDVGEGVGNEASLFKYISSCNIACGGHAGDLETMNHVVQLAKKNHIKMGAHPSYPDKANFGRKVIQISDSELRRSIERQLLDFGKILDIQNCELHHIKAHGALYNETARNSKLAEVYLDTLLPYREKALLYVPDGSVKAEKAIEMGFDIWYEAFADRNYESDLKLVSRVQQDAVIETPSKVLEHMLRMIKEDRVLTLNGEIKKIEAQTYCVHGDTPSALEILTYLSQELPKHQVELQK